MCGEKEGQKVTDSLVQHLGGGAMNRSWAFGAHAFLLQYYDMLQDTHIPHSASSGPFFIQGHMAC